MDAYPGGKRCRSLNTLFIEAITDEIKKM